jgi:hypothetical protein
MREGKAMGTLQPKQGKEERRSAACGLGWFAAHADEERKRGRRVSVAGRKERGEK